MAQFMTSVPTLVGRAGRRSRGMPIDSKLNICADMAQLAEQLTCNQQVIGSSPIIGFYYLDGFPSGQRGQTVNLLATLSKVRILPHPLNLISRGGAVWKLVGLITRRS